ncbi:hypothetical protein B0H12DRAFT_46479 [Mycena haematopus]|nr:hypothetical protein B0H12DRAFT_46479 [Mycena haematopus]
MEDSEEEDHDDAKSVHDLDFEDDLENRIATEEDPGEDSCPEGETHEGEEDERKDIDSDILESQVSVAVAKEELSEDAETLAEKLAGLDISQDTNTPKSQFRAESPVSVAVANEGLSRDAETLAEKLAELDISQETRPQVDNIRKSRLRTKSPALAKKDISQVTQPQEKLLTNPTLQNVAPAWPSIRSPLI